MTTWMKKGKYHQLHTTPLVGTLLVLSTLETRGGSRIFDTLVPTLLAGSRGTFPRKILKFKTPEMRIPEVNEGHYFLQSLTNNFFETFIFGMK